MDPCTINPVKRGYAEAGDRLVHYRVGGSGPAIVLLHDSPRSSRLHLPLMEVLASRFRVFALDTPGYGNSDPLDMAEPTIPDFASALGEALAALGLEQAPLYATHTSAKIARAVRHSPEWLRQDLVSEDQAVRSRAEETLAAMIAASLKE